MTFKNTLFETATLHDQTHWFHLISDPVITMPALWLAESSSINMKRECSSVEMPRMFKSKCIKI